MDTKFHNQNKITKIEVQKRNKNRVNLYVDEEFLTACDVEIVYRFNLKVGKAVDISYINNIIKEDNYIKCKNAGIKIVERSYKTEKQVYDKLCEKGYEKESVENTIELLKGYNFIDDSRYVKAYIKEKLKKEGINKIKYDLIRKGVSEEIITEKLVEVDSNLQMDRLMEIAKAKYENLLKRETDKYKLYSKLGSFLARRGYSMEQIKEVLNKIIKK